MQQTGSEKAGERENTTKVSAAAETWSRSLMARTRAVIMVQKRLAPYDVSAF
jgi:hypothetical protein